MAGKREYALQKQCVKWLRANDILFIMAPNDMILHGSARDRARRMAGWKARGLNPGVPDLFILELGSGSDARAHPDLRIDPQYKVACGGLGVELKVGTNDLSPVQAEWREKMRSQGYAHVVVRSLPELQEYIALHRAPPARELSARQQQAAGTSADPVPLE